MNEGDDNMDDAGRELQHIPEKKGLSSEVPGIVSSHTGCWAVCFLVFFGVFLVITLPLLSSDSEPVFNMDLVATGNNQLSRSAPEDDDVSYEENSPANISFITRFSVDSDSASSNVSLTSMDSRVIERSPMGILPRIGTHGERAENIYARPFVFPAKPFAGQVRYIAIVVGSLGINGSVTSAAIEKLPPEVTLSFAPYGHDLQHRVHQALQRGHEVLLQLPMEPFGYPDKNPGPHTLLTSVPAIDNLDRLHWLMARFTGYFGVINYMGGKFVHSREDFMPILQEINLRGLTFIDDGSLSRSLLPALSVNGGMKSYSSDLVLDSGNSERDFVKALSKLEAVASYRGYAIGSATVLPHTITRLSKWLSDLSTRGFTLIPVSAISRLEAEK